MATNHYGDRKETKFSLLDTILGLFELLLSREAFRLYFAVVIGAITSIILYVGLGETLGKFDVSVTQRLQLVGCVFTFLGFGWVTLWLSEPRATKRKTGLTREEKRKMVNSYFK